MILVTLISCIIKDTMRLISYSRVCIFITALPITILLVGTLALHAQTGVEVAAKSADLLRDKDLTWAALFVAGLSTVMTGILVRVMVLMFYKFLEASVQKATSDASTAAELRDLKCEVEKLSAKIDSTE
jgi:hypothetical protein